MMNVENILGEREGGDREKENSVSGIRESVLCIGVRILSVNPSSRVE